MYYVYILKLKNGKIYTGYSANLRRRVQEHSSGNVKTTQNQRPVRLVFYESFYVKSDAQRREKYLKTTKGKRMIRLILRDSLMT